MPRLRRNPLQNPVTAVPAVAVLTYVRHALPGVAANRIRRGEIKAFTGIDDPYEPPQNPELTLDTVAHTPEQNARHILQYLIQQGYVRAD